MTKLEKINRQIEKLENKKRIAKNRLMLLNQRAKYLKKKNEYKAYYNKK